MTSSVHPRVSEEGLRSLTRRFRELKRFNGRCIGRCLCVDNLGRSCSEKGIRFQLKALLKDVVDIRFAGVEVAGWRFQWGWCCIEFSSVEAAIKAMELLDHVYIRMGEGSHCVLRPLLAHFPNWNVDDSLCMTCDGPLKSLHYGQPNTVDRESREFLKLGTIMQTVKEKIMKKAERDIVDVFSQVNFPRSHTRETVTNTRSRCGLLLLKNVPMSVTNDRLFAFFECIDPHVAVFRIQNPITQKPGCHVVVTLSSVEKAQLICEDIDTHMLLGDGFQPIVARVGDTSYMGGFESLFDRALLSAGLDVRHCPSTELVYFKEISNAEERRAASVRSVLDSIEHHRSCCWQMQRSHEKALHSHIVKKVSEIEDRFRELEWALGEVDRLCSQ